MKNQPLSPRHFLLGRPSFWALALLFLVFNGFLGFTEAHADTTPCSANTISTGTVSAFGVTSPNDGRDGNLTTYATLTANFASGGNLSYNFSLPLSAGTTLSLRYRISAIGFDVSPYVKVRLTSGTNNTGSAMVIAGTTMTLNSITTLNITIPSSQTAGVKSINFETTSTGFFTLGSFDIFEVTLTSCKFLPVAFGPVSATIKNNELRVNWSTETEINNDHFVIQGSKDGLHFTELGKLPSQAVDGQSTRSLQYQYAMGYNTAAGMLVALPAILGFAAFGFKKRRHQWLFFLIIMLVSLTMYACTKKDLSGNLDAHGNFYVKIIQINKDGSSNNSQVMKAVWED